MKVVNVVGGCPQIVLGKADLRDLEKGYAKLDEIAYRGRQGCLVGEQPYQGEQLERAARFVLSILAAARKQGSKPNDETPPRSAADIASRTTPTEA